MGVGLVDWGWMNEGAARKVGAFTRERLGGEMGERRGRFGGGEVVPGCAVVTGCVIRVSVWNGV